MSRTNLAQALGLLVLLGVSGCATLSGATQPPLVPTRYQTRTGPYTVFTNFPLPADAPEVRELRSLERQLQAGLGIRVDPSEAPIEVYVLADREAFAHFMRFHYPELPARRAFFLAQGDRRVVYAYRGDRLEEDLRHESTHALLHAAVADLPLWLDEGLAEYFEGPDERGGLNPEHLARLPGDLEGGWRPDLARLEGLKDVRQMSPRDYRESWAWVHFLLDGPPAGKAALLAFLDDLRKSPDARPLSERLEPLGSPGELMVAHLKRAEARPVAARPEPPVPTPTVRLQDEPIRPRRRGFFGRMRDALGL